MPSIGRLRTWLLRPSLTHPDYLLTRNFPALDGLRAIAASMVVVFHYGGPHLRFVQGWIGVHVFFVLSGFLITTLALREFDRAGRVDLKAFYLRRLFRIVPVYLVVLALLVLQSELNHVGQARLRSALPYYLTFLNEYAPSAVYIQSWTLGIEQKFYLLWPVLAFVLVRRARGRSAVVVTTIVVLAALIYVPGVNAVHYLVLLLGAGLAILLHHPRGFHLVRGLFTPLGAVLVPVAFVAFHLQLTGVLARFGERPVLPFYGLAVCLLIPAVLTSGPSRWLLSLPPMVFVGQRSYSLYLVQGIAHAMAWGLLPLVSGRASPTSALVVWAVAVLSADLLYRWVEQPMIRVGKRVAGRGRAVSGEVPARDTVAVRTAGHPELELAHRVPVAPGSPTLVWGPDGRS